MVGKETCGLEKLFLLKQCDQRLPHSTVFFHIRSLEHIELNDPFVVEL